MCVAVFLVAGTDFFLGQFLQLVVGQSPFVAGLWLLPGVGGLIAGSLLAPALLARARAAHVLTTALALAAAGAATLTQLGAGEGLTALVIGTVLIGLGAGAVGTLATDFVVGTAPAERAGAASAITETGAELGGALGVAVLGSIAAAVYRADLDTRAPSTLTSAQLKTAKESLASTVDLGDKLPARLGADVIDIGRTAFTHAVHLGALSAAIIAAMLAVLAAFSLRG
jgi:DHA2 family multidrug resistance protein-like MFS transporter